MDYVAQLAASHDTVGTERQFQTTSGRTVSVSGSAYGWKIDQDGEAAQLTQEIQSGTQTTREPVYSMRANAYGVNDFGNTYIEVDLTEQYMWYYQDGNVIFESDIVSGLASDPKEKLLLESSHCIIRRVRMCSAVPRKQTELIPMSSR